MNAPEPLRSLFRAESPAGPEKFQQKPQGLSSKNAAKSGTERIAERREKQKPAGDYPPKM
ncbi:hypothetical protein OPIT5_27340 [Opitutaceae bacterium TAV5]|nr:hypothetical protein OPIT5_27340 [Opitutaceae bacterium TAV5]